MKTNNTELMNQTSKFFSKLFLDNNFPLINLSNSDLLDGKFFTANIPLPTDFPHEYRDSNKTLCHVRTIFISLFIHTNKNGISNPNDIEKTLTVSISFLGETRKFRSKRFSEATINKHYEYYRFGDDKNHTDIINEMSKKSLSFIQQIVSSHK